MSPPISFNALLLAGGRSRRMGRDKALLEWRGHPLWLGQVEKLLALRPRRTFIACRQEQQLAAAAETPAGVEWIYDPPEEDCGPMGAIGRALSMGALPVLVLAVDLPLMTGELLGQVLRSSGGGETTHGVFYSRRAGGVEPLAGLYTPAMGPAIQAAFSQGHFSPRDVILAAAADGQVILLELPDEAHARFLNVNEPPEWQRASADETV